MKVLIKGFIATAGTVMVLALSACGGSSSSDSSTALPGTGVGQAGVYSSAGFQFPQAGDTSATSIQAQGTGNLPGFSARQAVSKGTGSDINFGDPVQLRYKMYSWSTGELVEDSDNFDEALTVRAGMAEAVPAFLSQSLVGRNVGDRIQVVFEKGMKDLPSYFDANDAYVVYVDIL